MRQQLFETAETNKKNLSLQMTASEVVVPEVELPSTTLRMNSPGLFHLMEEQDTSVVGLEQCLGRIRVLTR